MRVKLPCHLFACGLNHPSPSIPAARPRHRSSPRCGCNLCRRWPIGTIGASMVPMPIPRTLTYPIARKIKSARSQYTGRGPICQKPPARRNKAVTGKWCYCPDSDTKLAVAMGHLSFEITNHCDWSVFINFVAAGNSQLAFVSKHFLRNSGYSID